MEQRTIAEVAKTAQVFSTAETARAQRRERLERLADAGRLVQHRHDDGQPRRHAWKRSSARSSRVGACARRQAPAAYLFASASVG